ncbi:hypothetical protein PMI10_03691, partial [Flavobacterium sp. CF136]
SAEWFSFLKQKLLHFSRPDVPAIRYIFSSAKKWIKRMPLLSGLARGLVFIKTINVANLCQTERSRSPTQETRQSESAKFCGTSTSLSLTKMRIKICKICAKLFCLANFVKNLVLLWLNDHTKLSN